MLTPEQYVAIVRNTFAERGDPTVAAGQMDYMRNQFKFFGLKMPAWTAEMKRIVNEHGLPEGDDLKTVVRLCFEADQREMHYFALSIVERTLKKQDSDFIDFLEELICTRSWWDTVDWINKLVGQHFKRFPKLIPGVTARWMDSGNRWLQRVCLIFQLTYRDQTDAALLFGYVLRVAHSNEFFLQKGAGWALRQYSKYNPEAVRAFIQNNTLSPLTRREGMKYL